MTYIFSGKPSQYVQNWLIDSIQPIINYQVRIIVETTDSHYKLGIYLASRKDSTKPIVIDWGDGNVEEINDNVSQKVHLYASSNTFIVTIDNISSYQMQMELPKWDLKHNNAFLIKSVNVDNLAIINEAFYGCNNLSSITIGSNVTTIGYDAFAYTTALTNISIEKTMSNVSLMQPNYNNWGLNYGTAIHCIDGDIYVDGGSGSSN